MRRICSCKKKIIAFFNFFRLFFRNIIKYFSLALQNDCNIIHYKSDIPLLIQLARNFQQNILSATFFTKNNRQYNTNHTSDIQIIENITDNQQTFTLT